MWTGVTNREAASRATFGQAGGAPPSTNQPSILSRRVSASETRCSL